MVHRIHRLSREATSQLPYAPGYYPNGVNVIGPLYEMSGLGQSARLLSSVIMACGRMPACFIENHVPSEASQADDTMMEYITKQPEYCINLLHIAPFVFAESYHALGKTTFHRRYNIAYWLWELEDFPKGWLGALDVVDEVWTPSEFVSNSIRKVTDKPVVTVPYAVKAPTDCERYNRAYFGLPEETFLFLIMYDSGSLMERKNPLGAVEAYRKAFIENKDHRVTNGIRPGFVVKMNGKNEAEEQRIRSLLGDIEDVFFITERLPKVAVNSLIADVDVFVSLHRAEGFGLVMAEAMLNGTPCIATNWSANTEFMNSEVGCMVDYQLVELTHDIGPYERGMHWADPNVKQASDFMRRLYGDKEYYECLSIKSKEYIRNTLSMERVTDTVSKEYRRIITRNVYEQKRDY